MQQPAHWSICALTHPGTHTHTHKYTLAAKQPTWHKEIGSCPFRTLRQGQAGRDRSRQAARQKREGGRVWSMANCISNEVCVCFAITLGWNCLEFVTHLGESTGHDDGPNKMDAVSGRWMYVSSDAYIDSYLYKYSIYCWIYCFSEFLHL